MPLLTGVGPSGFAYRFRLHRYSFDPLNSPTVTLAANDDGSVAADVLRFIGGPGGATDVAYLHTDHLGTPQVMTDANAQLLWWRDQTPFGQTVASGGFSENKLRFPGQYADAESGLAYNYFRDYDPALGRYIQSDPIGLGGGLNTYGYVGGNPVSNYDPRGLETIVVVGARTAANPFGHSAVATTGQGVVSYGTGTPMNSSLNDYLEAQSKYRDNYLFRIDTTPEQELAIQDYLAQFKDDLPPVPGPDSDDTCASRVNGALWAAGYFNPGDPIGYLLALLLDTHSPLPENSGMIANFGADSEPVFFPQGGFVSHPALTSFDPE